jgi:hypothetical protein
MIVMEKRYALRDEQWERLRRWDCQVKAVMSAPPPKTTAGS